MIHRVAALLALALIGLGSTGCGRYGAPVRRPAPRPEAESSAAVSLETGEPAKPAEEDDEEAATRP